MGEACNSIRGWLFGGHRFRQQTKDWRGLSSVTLFNGYDGIICTRCGHFDFTLLRGDALATVRTHCPTPTVAATDNEGGER